MKTKANERQPPTGNETLEVHKQFEDQQAHGAGVQNDYPLNSAARDVSPTTTSQKAQEITNNLGDQERPYADPSDALD